MRTTNLALSTHDKLEQGARCGCRGADDYCPCQNVPDRTTRRERAALVIAATIAGCEPADLLLEADHG